MNQTIIVSGITIESNRIKTLQQEILWWYSIYGRDLPRRTTNNPYYILLSEVMSQQTQISRVVNYYNLFINHYPTVRDLAASDTTELLSLWSWLWYNSRALRLQQACRQIVDIYDSIIPSNYDELVGLSGIWPYTANALLAFAYNQEVPVMDTNIRRILLYSFELDSTTPLSVLMILAKHCIPAGKSRIRHNALMDYGAIVLTSANTWIKPLTKQSPFNWSTRQTRSRFLKHLLQHHCATYNELMSCSSHAQKNKILDKMLQEWIIICQWNIYYIKK